MDYTEKIRRTTTRRQFEEMIEQMKSQPDIARNLLNQSVEVHEFWENLTKTLNSMGPPVKEISEWRKVWTEFKSSLKFGVDTPPPSVSPTVCIDQTNIEPIEVVELEVVTQEHDATHEDGNGRNSPDITTCTTPETGKTPSLGQLLKDHIGIQKMLHEKMSAGLAQNASQIGQIFLSLNRISELEANNNDILQALLDETKRHNRRMEKLASDKEEYLSDSTSE